MELVVTLQCWKVYAFDNVDRNAFWSSLVWIYNTYMYPWSNSLQWHKDSASRSSWYYWRCFRRKGAREAGWNPVSWFSYWLYHPKFLANPKNNIRMIRTLIMTIYFSGYCCCKVFRSCIDGSWCLKGELQCSCRCELLFDLWCSH